VNPRQVKLGGRPILVRDRQSTFWDRVEAGAWEPGTLRTIEGLVEADATFLDIGAWVGPTSLFAAACGAGRVVALEPDPAALDQLRANLAENPDLASRIEVVPRALHPVAGSVALGVRRKPGDSMSSVLLAGGGGAGFEAPALTPDELARMLPSGRRLVVKMDVEGAEYALLPALGPVLDRASALLVSFHPTVLAEAEPDSAARVRALRGALGALRGFRARPVGPRGPARASPRPALVRARASRELGRDDWLFDRGG
jgi:FkbM family methyltransferase